MKKNSDDIYLPNDLLIEILLLLPAKLLGQCKCVRKRWYNLIHDSVFTKIHLHHPKNTSLFAFSDDYLDTDYVFSLFNDESLLLKQDIDNPFSRKCIEVILGPVNGLYLMSYSNGCDSSYDQYQALWNPSKSEFRELPLLPFSIKGYRFAVDDVYFGFGYAGGDVKVVSITVCYRFTVLSNKVKIRLYSLKDDSWKDIHYDSVRFPFICKGAHPLCKNTFNHSNGVYYWVGTTDHDIMFLFDMKTEEFRDINLPILGSDMHVETICVRDNSSVVLFVKQLLEPGRVLESVDLFEMKDEGHWVKILTFDLWSTYVRLDAVSYGFWKKDEIVIKTNDKKVILYNMNSHEIRDLEIDWSHRLILSNYKESLFSVRGTTSDQITQTQSKEEPHILHNVKDM